jgi:hypothetical protein
MKQMAVLGGALRYEFLMQVRRISLWIGMLLLCTLVFRHFDYFYLGNGRATSARASIASWASIIVLFFPLGAGLLLADRLARDGKTRVDELLDTVPHSLLARLARKYLGGVLATLVPILLIYLVGVALIVTHWSDLGAIPLAFAIFSLTTGVAVLFVGAFSIACTTVLWPVLYQFLFVGYWFWGNFLNPHLGIPTLNGTLLTPSGRYIISGFFPSLIPYEDNGTRLQGIESLALLLGCAFIAQVATWHWLRWRKSHR